jgi:hypothetical protein
VALAVLAVVRVVALLLALAQVLGSTMEVVVVLAVKIMGPNSATFATNRGTLLGNAHSECMQ